MHELRKIGGRYSDSSQLLKCFIICDRCEFVDWYWKRTNVTWPQRPEQRLVFSFWYMLCYVQCCCQDQAGQDLDQDLTPQNQDWSLASSTKLHKTQQYVLHHHKQNVNWYITQHKPYMFSICIQDDDVWNACNLVLVSVLINTKTETSLNWSQGQHD